MAKADLGTKRLCPNCGAKYYDLNHSPILCPKCGTRFEAVSTGRSRAAPVVAKVEDVAEEADVVAEAEVISLEEADAETAGTDDDDEDEAAEVVEDTFLEPDDEAGEDVADIIGDVDEEEP